MAGLYANKKAVKDAVQSSSIKYKTYLRPGWPMHNYLDPPASFISQSTRLTTSSRSHTPRGQQPLISMPLMSESLLQPHFSTQKDLVAKRLSSGTSS
jgi:hypothetical protein